MRNAPLAVPALAFVAGIVAEAHGLALAACCAAAAASGFACVRVAAAIVVAGVLCGATYGHPAMIETESRTARFAGTVVGDVHVSDDGRAAFIAALDDGITVRAQVRGRVVSGERLVIRGRLVPFDEARNPGEPSRRAISAGEGLAGELAGDRIVARGGIDPHDVRTWAARVRSTLSARLRALVAEPEVTVVAGALWGERGTLPHLLRDDFQATGTVHVLVTAGLHLGVVAGLAGALLGLLRIPRVAASLAAIPCVVAYAWLSGGHLPSERAAVMVCVALLARACGARVVSWNTLALAALVVAAAWPASVGTVSFALSFSCVAAIGMFARPIERALERCPMPARVREALSLTVATQIGVWPLSAATFGLIAPYAVLANAVVVPATGVAMVAGIATLACGSVALVAPAAAAFVATFAAQSAASFVLLDVDIILAVVRFVATLPGARVAVAPPPAIAIVAYDAAATAAAALLRRRPRLALAVLAAATVGVLCTTLRPPDGRMTITMLDVGQGDGIVIRTPRGHTILIDSGGRLERGSGAGGESPAELVGERVVLAYLRRTGVRRIDLLVNTHPHGDHVGGCAPIIDAMPVRMLFDSGQQYGGRAFRDCMHEAATHGVEIVRPQRGYRWMDDGVMLDILAPSFPVLADTGDDINENSIVAMLHYGNLRELFMGDAGESSEARLLASGIDLHADVLKVGHHGSQYASTPPFIAAVHPQVAIISVGRHNTFGHPAPSTLAALQRAGATIYRTDRCGAATFSVPRVISTMLECRPLDVVRSP